MLPCAPSRKAITSVVWPLPPGKLAAVIRVSPTIATGAFVKAGSFCFQTTEPSLRLSAIR